LKEGTVMLTERADKLLWIFLFVGLAGLGLGVSVARSDGMLGWAFMLGGGVLMLAGAAILWRRSRARSNP
jgi:predicted membrane channel-forming protein YqfA (hemolysin III family)